MKNESVNRYKMCRENAGFIQENAAELLHISVRQLSNYENDNAPVPDDVVASMAEIYDAPLLAWWHLKENSVLGRFLPEIIMPQTHGDMAFQLVLAEDDLSPAVKSMKKILSNGQIDDHEWDDFTANVKIIRQVKGKLFSVVAYASELEKSRSRGKEAFENGKGET